MFYYQLTGSGSACGYTAAIVAVSFNFRRKRNLAIGIAMSGIGLGMFAFAPLMQMARDYYGFTGFFITMAGIHINIITAGVLCFPSQLEKYSQAKRNPERNAKISNRTIETITTYVNVLLRKGIVCICFSMLVYGLGSVALYVHLPKYIISKGFTNEQAAFLLALSGIANTLGRLGAGCVANFDRVSELFTYSGSMAAIAIVTMIYPSTAHYYACQVVFVVSLGLFVGCCFVVIPTLSLRFVGIEHISTAIGTEFLFCGLGAICGPVIVGKICASTTYRCLHNVIFIIV